MGGLSGKPKINGENGGSGGSPDSKRFGDWWRMSLLELVGCMLTGMV